jgi:hypothetical protein
MHGSEHLVVRCRDSVAGQKMDDLTNDTVTG